MSWAGDREGVLCVMSYCQSLQSMIEGVGSSHDGLSQRPRLQISEPASTGHDMVLHYNPSRKRSIYVCVALA